jgi:hypothetical protein
LASTGQCGVALAPLVEQPRERQRRVGTGGLELERAAQRVLVALLHERVGLRGQQPVEELADLRRRLGADELADQLAVLERLDRGMPWIRKAAEICWLASVSSLARSMSGSRLRTSSSSTGVSCRQGPHHSAQKSTTTGTSCERAITSCSKVASVTSRIMTPG